MRKRTILLNPDPADNPPTGDAPPCADALRKNPDAKESDAAAIVELKRRAEKAERDAEDARKVVKERETRIAELEDQNHQLKNPPAPAPKKSKLNDFLW